MMKSVLSGALVRRFSLAAVLSGGVLIALPGQAAGAPRPSRRIPPRGLPAGEEIILRDFRLRLVRILENDPKSDVDDSVVVEVSLREKKSELTLRELRIGEFEGYEIHVLQVVPSAGKPGGGTARIRVEPPAGR